MPNTANTIDIRCLCLDVDGVLTDGRVWWDDTGRGARAFHVHDGFGIKCFQKLGGIVAICSGKESDAVSARMTELGIEHVIQGSRDKLADVGQLLSNLKLGMEHVAMVGDDLPDLPVMRRCALPIAVANAVTEVKAAARCVTKRSGGEGAVREAIECVLRESGRWSEVLGWYGAADVAQEER